jgi:hypothetical protein
MHSFSKPDADNYHIYLYIQSDIHHTSAKQHYRKWLRVATEYPAPAEDPFSAYRIPLFFALSSAPCALCPVPCALRFFPTPHTTQDAGVLLFFSYLADHE